MNFIQGLRKEMKVVLVIIFVIFIGYLSYLYWVSLNLADHTIPHTISLGAIGEDATVKGNVLDIDATPMFVDGDGLITIRTADYGDVVIGIPAGETQCEAEGLERFHELQVGDEVEAFGTIRSENKVTPCTSADHYLKILGEDRGVALTGIDVSDWQTYINEEFGFEVKYPTGWYARLRGGSVLDLSSEQWSRVGTLSPNGVNLQIQIMISSALSEVLAALENMDIGPVYEKDLVLYTKLDDMVIGEISAVRYTADRNAIPYIAMPVEEEIMFKKEDHIIFQVRFLGFPEAVDHQKKLMNQILSTFRFIE